MTQRVLGAQLPFIRRREPITAEWLNNVAAKAERNAKKVDDIETEVELGEDGDGTTKTRRMVEDKSQRQSTLVRYEDDTDPTVYIDVERIDQATFINDKDSDDRLILVWDWS